MEINNKEFYKRKDKNGKTCPIDIQVLMDKMGVENSSVHIENQTWENFGKKLKDLKKFTKFEIDGENVKVTRLDLLDME